MTNTSERVIELAQESAAVAQIPLEYVVIDFDQSGQMLGVEFVGVVGIARLAGVSVETLLSPAHASGRSVSVDLEADACYISLAPGKSENQLAVRGIGKIRDDGGLIAVMFTVPNNS